MLEYEYMFGVVVNVKSIFECRNMRIFELSFEVAGFTVNLYLANGKRAQISEYFLVYEENSLFIYLYIII